MDESLFIILPLRDFFNNLKFKNLTLYGEKPCNR